MNGTKWTKVLTLTLALALLLTTLGGFGLQSAQAQGTRDAGGLQLPLVDQVTKISWMVMSPLQNLNELPIVQEIKKRTNVELDIQAYPDTTYVEKLKMVVGSGSMPDIIGALSLAEMNTYGEQGAFEPINKHLDVLPNFKSIFVDDPANSWMQYSYSSDAGNLYFWPIYGLNRDVNFGYMYRADIFQKNNLKPWTNLDEFYDNMKALKAIYPDSYPFASKSGATFFSRQATYWGVDCDAMWPYYYNEEAGLWKFAGTDDQFKAMLDFWKKCYNEGLLDPEFLTDTQDTWTGKITTDKSFIINDWIGRLELLPAQMKDVNPDFDLRYGMPIGSTGKQFPLRKFTAWGPVVTAGANAEVALKLLDYLSSPEGSELFTIGIEGETFTWDENGKPYYPELKDEPFIDINLLGERYGMWTEGMYLRPDHRSIYYNFTQREQEAQDMIVKNNLFSVLDPVIKLSNDESAIFAENASSLQKELETFASQYIMEKTFGDAQWEEWKTKAAQLQEGKVADALNAAQKRYDESTSK
ncbi:MAG: extracellular solute-binding protein [Clostridia bacterium]